MAVHREGQTAEPNAGRVPVIVDGGRVVHDSTAIADYLEERYADRPSLYGGEVGRGVARFVQNWTETVLQTGLIRLVLLDIHRHLGPEDQAYFRSDREKRFGTTLEEVVKDREARLPAFRASLDPLRRTVERQAFVSRRGAGLCRLHRVRRLSVGARDQRFRAAGGGRPGARLARPHARPVRRAGRAAPRPTAALGAGERHRRDRHDRADPAQSGGGRLGRRHVLCAAGAAAGDGAARAGAAAGFMVARARPLLRLGDRRDRAAAGERLRHDFRGLMPGSAGSACTSTSCRASASS